MSILDAIHDMLFYDEAIHNLRDQGDRQEVADARKGYRTGLSKAQAQYEDQVARRRKYGKK